MDKKDFWLLDIGSSALSVSLVQFVNGIFNVSQVGPVTDYRPEKESIIAAVDTSLSAAATAANLPQEAEPSTVALILSPYWIDTDGKILSGKIKLIEDLCRELKLKPLGFIANDEAIVEDANHADGFPASFILVHFGSQEMTVSLTYLGKIIERINKPISAPFDPKHLENTLLEFKTDSTLPPSIILLGQVDETDIDSIKNYSWIDKKNIETFLHFPDIKSYSPTETAAIYTRSITSQFDPQPQKTEPVVEEVLPVEEPIAEIILPHVEPPQTFDVEEVDPADLGFSADFALPSVKFSDLPTGPDEVGPPDQELNLNFESEKLPVIPVATPPKPKINLPRLRFPKIKLPTLPILFLPLVLSPLLILIPFLFSQAKVTLFLTPYTFKKDLVVTLDPAVDQISLSQKVFPVSRQTYTYTSSASVTTTGQKTVGNKSIGEVIVYNKQDKSQNLSKGVVLIDDKGNKFELATNAQIASSSSNLDAGVITLGQTKVPVTAVEIGPEYNLNKDVKLHFKDFPETVIVAKVSANFSGGSKSQISAVSAADKTSVDQKIGTNDLSDARAKIDAQIAALPGVIKDSIQTKKGRVDYNREVGEEADQLTGNAVTTIYVFYLPPNKKIQMLQALFTGEEGFNAPDLDPDDFSLSLSSLKNSVDKLQGNLIVSGKVIPKVDTVALRRQLSGKFQSSAISLIKKSIPRVYNYQIATNFSFIKWINPLPYRLQNLTIEVK